MIKKIRIRRNHSVPVPVSVLVLAPVLTTNTVFINSIAYTVGELVDVKHISFRSWESLILKEIRDTDSGYTFLFYRSPPGWIAVNEEAIRPIKIKKTRKKGNTNVVQ